MPLNTSSRTRPYRVQKRATPKPKRRSPRLERSSKVSPKVTNRIPSPQSEEHTGHPLPQGEQNDRKRKRARDIEEQVARKRDRLYRTPSDSPEREPGPRPLDHEIHWEEYFGQWPPAFEQSPGMGDARASKRSRSASTYSYNKSVRDGESPAAWTRQHELKMQAAGLIMIDYDHRFTITDECRKLCEKLLKKKYALPKGSPSRSGRLAKILNLVRFRNEARIVRDILPLVVPSPELLHIDGCARLNHLCEAIDAEWTQCDTLCGPRPKPDFSVGISRSAFDDEEMGKLRLSHTSACPNLFPENMYFPFLICEVKGSDRPLAEAERQAMHSASIASRAIIQLHMKASLTDVIDQKVLVFSVAHDHSCVNIFAHFAKIEGEKITYFRHPLYSGRFDETAVAPSASEYTKAYHITRAIYEIFYPQHVARIKHVLSLMRSTQQVQTDDQQETSRDNAQFKKPSLPSTAKIQEENSKLRDQILELVRQMDQQREQQKDHEREQMTQLREQMERQMEQQKEQTERQMAQQREQTERQVAQMERRMAEQKELLQQQREQTERQVVQMERQMAQQEEIINLLKHSRSN